MARHGRGGRVKGAVGVLALSVAGLAGLAPLAAGQESDTISSVPTYPVDRRAARVPFGPGERLVYNVKVGILNVGRGHLAITGLDTVRGNVTYKGSLAIEGGLGPAKVDDDFQSWFAVRNLVSWRFIQDINDVGYKSYRHYEMFPDRRTWERQDNDELGTLGSSLPMDDIAFIYYIRTLPLQVGRTYTLNRYFKEDGNPVRIQVLRKDRRETAAGTFNTIVVKPLIKTTGLFGEGGDAEIHFSDDDRRLLVYLKSNIPKIPGSLTLHLEEIHEGLPLHPDSRAAALARREAQAADTTR